MVVLMAKRRQPGRRPFIGPCRDPLDLWFLEFETSKRPGDQPQVVRSYHEDRATARAARDLALTWGQLRMLLSIDEHARCDGWADWTAVYNTWDPKNISPGMAGQAAQKVWQSLERRNLVEQQAGPGDGLVRRKAGPANG